MAATRGYYGLIQYCPDPSKAEGANVGVLLFCPEVNFLEVRTSRGNDRARRFFGSSNIDLKRLEVAKRSFESRLRLTRDEFRSVEDLNSFMSSRANELRLIPPRPVKVKDPKSELESLFNTLVGDRSRTETAKRHFEGLETLFRQPRLANRVRFDEVVTVPIVGRLLKVPYAYSNGTVNLVLPRVFPESAESATGVAMKLALEGDLLNRYERKQLIVVAGFEGKPHERLTKHFGDLFTEYRTRLVLPAAFQEFATEVIEQAH